VMRRIVRALLWGALCFVGITSVFAGLYVVRLYASGFPPLDVQHDRERFAIHVLPIAAMGATIVFFGSLAYKGESIGSMAKGIIAVAVPVIVAVAVFDRMSSGIAVSDVSRGLFGCSSAFAFFLVISCMPQTRKRGQVL
jgi:hypothetical protein